MKLTLDLESWRCGGNAILSSKKLYNWLGYGPTKMLNSAGYSCCLGQFCKQLGAVDEELLEKTTPALIYTEIPPFNKYRNSCSQLLFNTDLSSKLMDINDSGITTVESKIISIKTLLKNAGVELEIKGDLKSIRQKRVTEK